MWERYRFWNFTKSALLLVLYVQHISSNFGRSTNMKIGHSLWDNLNTWVVYRCSERKQVLIPYQPKLNENINNKTHNESIPKLVE